MHYLKKELVHLISEREDIFDYIQGNSSDGIWFYNLENQEDLWFSDQFWKSLGYSSQEMPCKVDSWRKVIHPDDAEAVLSEISKHLENPNIPYFKEVRFTKKDGTIVWIQCTGIAIKSEEGQFTRMLGGHVNTSRTRDIESLLSQKSHRLNALLHSMPDILFIMNACGVFIEYFSNSTELLVLPPSKIVGAHISEVISEQDTQAILALIGKVLSGELELATYHYSLNILDETRYFEARITPSGVEDEVLAIVRDSTEEKNKNRELKKLELVTSRAKDAITITDVDGNITWVNEGFSLLTGYKPQEVIGKKPKLILQGQLTDSQTNVKIGSAIKKREPIIVEILNYHKNGSIYWIELSINPVYNNENILEGFISVGRDITARKHFETQLITAKNLLAHSSDVAKIGGWQVDLLTNEVSWTDGVFKLIGATRENFPLTFESSASIIHPDDSSRALQMFEDAIKFGKKYDIEKRFVKLDGTIIHIKSLAELEYNQDGNPIRILGVFQDITEQKLVAEELYLQSRLLDSVGQSVIATKPNGEIFYWNKKAEEIYGWSKEEVLGQNIVEVTPTSLEKDVAIKIMEELKNGNGWSGEFQVQNKNKELFPSQVTNQPFFDLNGNLEGIIGVSENITDRKNAELELLRTKNLLQQTNIAANVGGWESDFERKTFYWSELTRKILDLPDTYQPKGSLKEQINDGFSFYKEGFHRSRIMAAADHAMRTGEPFDVEVISISRSGDEKWVRVIGNAEMKEGRCLRLFGAIWDIDSKKKVDEVLRAERQKLNDIIVGSGLGTFEWDMLINFWNVNDQWYSIHGLIRETAPEFSEEYFKSIIHPDDESNVTNALNQHITGKEKYFESEFRIQTPLKEWKWVLIRGRISERNLEGKPALMYGTIQEISSLKNMENELKENAAKFSSIFHFSPVGISLNEFESGRFIEANEVLLNKLGFTNDEITNLAFSDVTPPEYDYIERNKKEELLKSNKFGPYEKEYKRKDGSTFPILCNCLKFTDSSGRELILTINQDISEQKKLINDLNQQRIKSSQDALYYKSLLENNSFFVVKTDLQGNYIFMNKYFCERLGIEAEDYVGKNAMKLIVPEDHQKCADTVAKCFENPGVSQIVLLRKPSPTGIVHNQWEFILMSDESGAGYEVICIGHEITPLIRKQEELQTLVDVTAEQNKRLMQFTHIVSHNLRSHVANLSSILSVTDITDIDDLNLSWNLVEKTTTALDETLHNLNEVINIQSDINIPYRSINVLDAFHKTVDSLQLLIDSTETKFKIEIDAEAEIQVIPAYLDSILLNFVSNAIKYRAKDRNPLVGLKLRQTPGFKVLTISDNGLGLDLERYKDRLFGMYKTFHGNKDAKGLGLFITKAQIDAMKGKVEIESEVGKGTSFHIYLPDNQ
jgi:PAS domain S-box-containing protein